MSVSHKRFWHLKSWFLVGILTWNLDYISTKRLCCSRIFWTKPLVLTLWSCFNKFNSFINNNNNNWTRIFFALFTVWSCYDVRIMSLFFFSFFFLWEGRGGGRGQPYKMKHWGHFRKEEKRREHLGHNLIILING